MGIIVQTPTGSHSYTTLPSLSDLMYARDNPDKQTITWVNGNPVITDKPERKQKPKKPKRRRK